LVGCGTARVRPLNGGPEEPRFELNHDQLSDPDEIKPDQTLKRPA
jgi:hypothetical protein